MVGSIVPASEVSLLLLVPTPKHKTRIKCAKEILRYREEEILRVLREAESGDTVVEVCRKHGISQQSFYLWKKKYAGLGLNELRELRQLRDENGKLKRLVADLSLDRHILQEIVAKKL